MKLNYQILKVEKEDLKEILNLQKICYLVESKRYNKKDIQPLTQTLMEIEEEFKNNNFFKVLFENKIIGSIRVIIKNNICHIGKVIVDPEFENKGIGTNLLKKIENDFNFVDKFELFTGYLSKRNIYFYKKNGYKEFDKRKIDEIEMIYLEKYNI